MGKYIDHVADWLLHHTYKTVYGIKPIIADILARSKASDACIRQQTKSSRVYGVAGHLCDTKSLSEPSISDRT